MVQVAVTIAGFFGAVFLVIFLKTIIKTPLVDLGWRSDRSPLYPLRYGTKISVRIEHQEFVKVIPMG